MLNLNLKLPAVLAALALTAAGCGGDDSNEQAAPAVTTDTAPVGRGGEDKRPNNDPVVTGDMGTESIGTVKVSETEYRVELSEQALLTEGVWTFEVTNGGSLAHALDIKGPNGETESGTITPGEARTVKAYLTSGTYELYCPIGDHEERGMRAKLPVRG